MHWAVVYAGMPLVPAADTLVPAQAGLHYVLLAEAATTLVLPAEPGAGDVVAVTTTNGLETNVIACAGQPVMGVAEDMVLDIAMQTLRLQWIEAPGISTWRIV
ncbi:hypothetical protein CBP35_13455 [Acidovorax carolinensis]|uniref:hypothetical protein n=1 Tax=Acidovorax carolinensis TaxID=553814 RepID=UPI000B615BF4|nr:hypothetical protein [Acidovorax carolinensis]ART55745.1 hypothetical protein CBP35_13455 [Acidovorax carolinensis]